MRFPEEVMWALTSQYVNVHNLFIYLFIYLSIYTILADAALRKLFCNTGHSNTAHHSYHNQIS